MIYHVVNNSQFNMCTNAKKVLDAFKLSMEVKSNKELYWITNYSTRVLKSK